MNDLVQRLSKGNHRVEVSCRPKRTTQAFKEAIERGYVHIKFTKTRGGTELGVAVTDETLDLSRADFENSKGTVLLQGDLTLDYVPVRLVAKIRLATLTGQGHLEIRELTNSKAG